MTYIKAIILWVMAVLSTSSYAQGGLLGDVDKQWLCDNQETIYAGVDEKDPSSIYHAGLMFFQGACVIKDFPFAFSLFVEAADEGYINAYHVVAIMSHIGLGTKQDLKNADRIFAELLKANYSPTVRYACAIQKGDDKRIAAFSPLNSLNNYSDCKKT